ncbi:hypothetical protein LTR08_001477 [Meristemomyces frigidus]|nr:hypothetical protein LTR08_001477 [Meristemomyces frigidus]
MDPLTALSVAGNVIQLISFAHELVTEGSKIYQVVDGVVVENKDAETLATDLCKLNEGLTESQSQWIAAHKGQQLDPDEMCLRDLCARCSDIAEELILQLQKLKVKDTGATSKTDKIQRIARSGKQALLSAWRKDAREKLASRLEGFQREIDTRILFSLRKGLQASNVQSTRQYQTLDQRTKDLMVTIISSGDKIDDRLVVQTAVLSQLAAEQAGTKHMLFTLVQIIERNSTTPELIPPCYTAPGVSLATPLHKAAEAGEAQRLRQLLRLPQADINAKDENGCTPLHLASTVEVIKRLMGDKRVNLHAENFEGQTALHCAVLERRLEVIKALLEAGLDKTIADDHDKTAAFFAKDCPAAAWMLRYGPETETRATDHLDNTGLLQMAWLGDLEGTRFFISQTADVNARNKLQETALTEAARHGDAEVVLELLAANADMELSAGGEWTPLLQAIRDGRDEIVTILLDKGANREAKLRSGNTALAEACWRHHTNIACWLIERGCNVDTKDCMGNTPVLKAADRGTPRFLRWLLNHGADHAIRNNYGETAVFRAASGGHSSTLLELLKAGAGWDTHTKFKNTPLSMAAQKGHHDIVKLLLDYGADPNVRDRLGHTPLAVASRHGHVKVVLFLLDHGAKVEIFAYTGFTALSVAARQGRDDVVRVLANAGANMKGYYAATLEGTLVGELVDNNPEGSGTVSLMRAARNGHTSTVGLLLELGAEMNCQDGSGRTALHFAVEWMHVSVVDTLVKRGANVDLQCAAGTSPLMTAARKGSVDIARLLVQAHANLRLRDDNGRTAWIHARHSANDRKFKELLEPSAHEDEA